MLIGCIALIAAATVAAMVLGRTLGRNIGFVLALPLLAAGGLLVVASAAGPRAEVWPWMSSIGVSFALRLDGLGLLFGLLVTVIGAGVLFYSARYLGRGAHTGFYVLMSVFALAMLVLVLADDVVLLFVAWEATTLCSFFLIARSGAHAREPAIRTLMVTALGGLSLLGAAAAMTVAAGTTRISEILEASFWTENSSVTTWIVVLLVGAAFTKSAQFPFHAWLPDSMVAITPVSAYLHAAAMVKAGIYLLLLFSPVLNDNALWSILLIYSGAVTALLGGIAALRRTDLKELLAYSTISQLGLLVLLIGVGTPEALTAAVVHTVAHALFKAALFMVVGILDHQAGTRNIRELARLNVRMPVTLTIAALAALSMAGVPLLLGFVSKESMFVALLSAPGPEWLAPVITSVAALTAVLTFAYAGRFVIGAAGGRAGRLVGEAPALFWAAPAVWAAAGLTLGLVPALLDPLVGAASSNALGAAITPELELWHGLTPALFISILVLSTGTALVLLRAKVDPVMSRVRFPFHALSVVDSIRASIIGFGASVARLSASSAPRHHLLIPVLSLLVIAGVGVIFLGELPPIVGDPTHPLDWVLVSLILVGTAATVLARTRVAAVVVVGVIGFAMTLWFFWLGAADVALTQLLVEILTICVLVLVLRRLPRRFRRDSVRRRISSLTVAIAAGVATTLGVIAFTGRRELSTAADYYLRNAENETGGANIVNTILVDFRALDTLGELTVLGVAGVAVAALLSARRTITPAVDDTAIDEDSPLANARHNSVFAQSLTRWAGPLTILLSLLLLLRGHQDPGGGFIAALVGGAGFALVYLAAPTDDAARIRWPYILLIGAGIVVATLSGLLGFVDGSFLRPLHADVLGMHLTTALLFDVGVYLAVIGVVLASLNLLGLDRRSRTTRTSGPATSTTPIRTKEGTLR
ncbi:multisubunit sodium/proton antiporter MrpA subunit /multisubunit sodium/proton antiporter MrpB subunit [Rhodoglobus vestalii]|uniref:Multisubunit sodium/proton antiporter MrpA subunit /multisubunit sodium/proton antiporter MrpB subunit n=1 Tax=Rhodoglobus vestalii TaxID=193384 RepID=A0A8H2KAL6_9MICO|nr:DUF4040 family protein [Rhodoglobus vestalii]TQO20711.1 multisubunit sodium/proton antiporter MrpA subunit /multisubunit sodium/proton antiporter MrpB subunit [Rhodoglobus vestalii]